MNAQEIFDKVVTHLRVQNCKSIISFDTKEVVDCAYRGQDGTMCAAGCLIPDNLYDSDMEGINFTTLTVQYKFPNYLTTHRSLISKFQTIHDDTDVQDWEYDFKCLAEEFKLIYTPL